MTVSSSEDPHYRLSTRRAATTYQRCQTLCLPKRLPSDQEYRFNTELSTLTSRIIADMPAEKRHEHASKTYYMMAAYHKEILKRKETEDGSGKEERPFVALGRFRSAEREHLLEQRRGGL